MNRRAPATTAIAALALLLAGCTTPATDDAGSIPRRYVCQRPTAPLVLDGLLGDEAWRAATWSEDFVDIEGDRKPAPRHRTRTAMLWDDDFLYVAAELEEPELMAYLTKRDSVIFHENDFEVFVDPDGDTHRYVEIEVNARGTVWDLFLERPYRDGVQADHSWDIEGLVLACALDGTLNDPSDRDRGWSLEMAIPWAAFARSRSAAGPPRPGEHWRMNFSRVQWLWDVEDGRYRKRLGPRGEKLPEFNWVWSPQGAIAMHMPEMWGFVQFSARPAGSADRFLVDPEQAVRDRLFRYYHAQRRHRARTGSYAADLDAADFELAADARVEPRPSIELTGPGYVLSLPRVDGAGRHEIDQQGRLRSRGD